MTIAAKHSIAFHLGRALGTVARFCLHDRNPRVRWVKRVVIITPLAFLVATNISWILSTILTAILLVAGIYAFSKVDFSEECASEDSSDDDNSHRAPFYGEYEHPNYHMHYDD